MTHMDEEIPSVMYWYESLTMLALLLLSCFDEVQHLT